MVPLGKGIVVMTLTYGDEVRDPKDYFKEIDPEKGEPKLLKLVTELIDERTKSWEPEMVADPVQDKLLAIIKSKQKKGGKKLAKKEEEPASKGASNVISLMDALKKSLEKPKRKA